MVSATFVWIISTSFRALAGESGADGEPNILDPPATRVKEGECFLPQIRCTSK